MAKCIRCGKNTLIRGHVKLADSAICTPCFKQLGFKLTETAGATVYNYDDIKDGKDNVHRNMAIRRKKHEKWLEEHPDVGAFMDALNEPDEDKQEPDQDEIIED